MGIVSKIKQLVTKKAATKSSDVSGLGAPIVKKSEVESGKVSTTTKATIVDTSKSVGARSTVSSGSGSSSRSTAQIAETKQSISLEKAAEPVSKMTDRSQKYLRESERMAQESLRQKALSAAAEQKRQKEYIAQLKSEKEQFKEDIKTMSISKEKNKEKEFEFKEEIKDLEKKGLRKEIKLKYYTPEFGTVSAEAPKGYAKTEFISTVGETYVRPALQLMELPGKAVKVVAKTSEKGYEQMFFGGKGTEIGGTGLGLKERKKTSISGLGAPVLKESEIESGVATPKKTLLGKAVGSVSEVIEFGSYLTPAGEALLISEAAAGTEKGLFAKTREEKKAGWIQAGVSTAFLTGGAAVSKGIKIRKKKIIASVEKEISKLEDIPIRSVTLVDEGTGIISAKGIKEIGGVKQEIMYTGIIKETEKGIKFVPTGEGATTIVGKTGKRSFIVGQEFELGARGKSIPVGKIGEARVFEEIGTSTLVPKMDYFATAKLSKGELTTSGLLRLKKEVSKGIESVSPVIKDIKAPVGERNVLIGLQEQFYLRGSKRELGTVIIKKAQKEEVQLGFKGMGKKSSGEYFGKLYAKQETVIKPKVKPEIPTINLGKISAEVAKGIKPTMAKQVVPTMPMISKWSGAGKYERMTTPVMASSIGRQQTMQEIKIESVAPKISTMPVSQVKVFEPAVKVEENSKIKIGARGRIGIKSEFKPFEDIKPKEEVKITPKEIQAQKTKGGLLQKMKEVLEQKQEIGFTFEPTTPTPTIPSTPVIKIPKIKEPGKVSIPSNGMFKVFVTKAGKAVEEKRVKTKKEAEELLYGVLGKRLTASGFVTFKGKKVKLGVREGFRASKVDPFKIVEKKEQRIKRKEKSKEAREIQAFRKRGGKSGFF